MNKLKKEIYNLLRKYLLKEMTNNLGKYEELDDKIICYVSNTKLKRKSTWYTYQLILQGNKKYDEEILNLYKINKPIEFIIKDALFKQPLCVIASETTNITFKNCEFHEDLCVRSAGNVVLENNKYKNYHDFSGNCLNSLTIKAKSLKLQSDNFINECNENRITKFGIQVDANNIEIENSNIKLREKDQDFSIRTKNLFIKDSNINCYNDVYIESDEINIDNSIVESKSGITIKNKHNNEIMGVKSPKTIYNDINVSKNCCITKEVYDLVEKRLVLIDRLKKLRDYCVDINNHKLEEISNNLNNRNISKFVKVSKK